MNTQLLSPDAWPKEIKDLYTPVRVIGKGGFASVWMAKRKTTSSSNGTAAVDDDDHVAIKITQGDAYALREIAVLSELSSKYHHPNLIRLLHQSKTKGGGGGLGIHYLVLSLARGPTLNCILTKFGALGLVIAQSISQQLICAVAFLHGHAVIHRDIQPANIIVSEALLDNDLWWSDELDIDGALLKMAKKCHITIIDFGFARALSPDDIKDDIGLKKVHSESLMLDVPPTPEQRDVWKNYGDHIIDSKLDDTTHASSRGRNMTLGDSFSRNIVRELSALGTRSYAAPEILGGIRNRRSVLNRSMNGSGSGHKRRKKTTLGECVSSYGMIADAFSVGATIRHMVTGVPPSENVEEFIAAKNRPMKLLIRSLKDCIKKDNPKQRVKKYRMSSELPEDLKDLIQNLTHSNAKRRATVRSATSHPWIKASVSKSKSGGHEIEHGGPIVFLECGGD